MPRTTTIDPAIRERAMADLDTPITAHDCEMDEMEAVRYEDGIDIPDNRYL